MTKLFLRSTTTNSILDTGDGILYDLSTTAGSSLDTATTNTTGSGTEIQATKTAGGSTIAWISGRAPSGGFTLTNTDISIWQMESATQANIGGRYRVFKRAANGTITELGGGPFDDGIEMGTTIREDTWPGNVTDTVFAEDDRILIRYYLTNIGTMGASRTGTMNWNAADGSTGDSFLNIAETVTFKLNDIIIALTGNAATGSVGALGVGHAQPLTGTGATSAVGTVTPSSGSPSFPSTSVVDSFNRADEGPPPSSNWTNISTGLSVSGNKLNASFGHRASYWSTSAFDATQEARITLSTLNAGFSRFGLTFRMQSADPSDCYFIFATSDNVIEIWTMINGSLDTQLGSSISQTIAAGDSLGVSVDGSVITVWYKTAAGSWTSLGTRTDSTYTSGGFIGVRTFSDNGVQLDDFGGGTITVSSDVTVALTGVSATASAGSVAQTRSTSLSGVSTASSTGLPGVSRSIAASGVAITSSSGSVISSQSAGLSGTGATTSTGTLIPTRTVSISGNSTTTSAGTVTPGVSASAALTGVSVTASVGLLSPSLTRPLTGNSATSSVGTVTPVVGVTVGLTGVSATTSVGTLNPALTRPLAGVSSTTSVGTVTPSIGIFVALTGVQASASIGILSTTTSKGLTGQGITTSIGSIIPQRSISLSGVSSASAAGSPTTSLTVSITGVNVAASVGVVSTLSGDALAVSTNVASAVLFTAHVAIGTLRTGDTSTMTLVTNDTGAATIVYQHTRSDS